MFRKVLLQIKTIIIIITWTKGSFFGMFTSCCRREKQEVSSWRPSTARMDQHRHRGTDITEENKKDNFFRPQKKGTFFPSRAMRFLFISDSDNKIYSFTDILRWRTRGSTKSSKRGPRGPRINTWVKTKQCLQNKIKRVKQKQYTKTDTRRKCEWSRYQI